MGKRGFPKEPTALKVLKGNPRKETLNVDEPVPPPGEVLPPSWLQGKALWAWNELKPVLSAMKVLETSDPHALALLCDAYADYLSAQEVIWAMGRTYESRHLQMDADGNTFERIIIRPRPEVAIASDSWKRCRAMMQEFGLTPSARSGLKIKPVETPSDFEKWKQSAT